MTHCTLTTLVIFVAIWNLSQGRVEHDNWGQETRDFREEQGGEKEENTNEDGLDLAEDEMLKLQEEINHVRGVSRDFTGTRDFREEESPRKHWKRDMNDDRDPRELDMIELAEVLRDARAVRTSRKAEGPSGDEDENLVEEMVRSTT